MDSISHAKSPRRGPEWDCSPLERRDGPAWGRGDALAETGSQPPQEEAPESPPGSRGGGVTGDGAPRAASAAFGRSGSRPPCSRRPRGREEE